MNDSKEIIAMLTVIYKKIDNIEQKMNNCSRSAPYSSYLRELRKEAMKVMALENESSHLDE